MLLAVYPLFSQGVVVLTDSKGEYHLGRYFEILVDKEKKWSIQDVASPGLSGAFIKSRQETPNFGYTDAACWIRYKLKNNSSRDEWLLDVGYPLLDIIELYIPPPGLAGENSASFVMKKEGDSFAFKERELKHQHLVFSIPSAALIPDAHDAVIPLLVPAPSPIKYIPSLTEKYPFINFGLFAYIFISG